MALKETVQRAEPVEQDGARRMAVAKLASAGSRGARQELEAAEAPGEGAQPSDLMEAPPRSSLLATQKAKMERFRLLDRCLMLVGLLEEHDLDIHCSSSQQINHANFGTRTSHDKFTFSAKSRPGIAKRKAFSVCGNSKTSSKPQTDSTTSCRISLT